MLARIRQLDRMAGQFVFIAVLLDWSKFSCSPDVPPVCRTHLFRFHGTKRHPSQSFPRARHRVGLLRGGSTSAIEDSSPPQSSPWEPPRLRRPAASSPPTRPSPPPPS